MPVPLEAFTEHLGLGALLNALQQSVGIAAHVEHWTQGEFHHDLVLRLVNADQALPGSVLVVATNCNGGVKELLCFDTLPDRAALWHHRCPGNPEFSGTLPPILATARTRHWFDPCDLLRSDARSELRPEFRERQAGGGWQATQCRGQ
ncbi:hypothetical protein [Gemmatimonas aurantiaca]|uniref:hypothetical protein n=1 Tax=Gemmatimonas aurantiaca TaxID=173480 RepID=UPI00301DC410